MPRQVNRAAVYLRSLLQTSQSSKVILSLKTQLAILPLSQPTTTPSSRYYHQVAFTTTMPPPKPHDNGNTDTDLAKSIITHLRTSNQSLAVAESLTSGQLTATLTAVPGASSVVRGGVVTYATPLKHTILGVDKDLLAREGAVHPRVVVAMACGVRVVTGIPTPTSSSSKLAGGGGGGGAAPGNEGKSESGSGGTTDWGIATTGVAGPDPQDGKPAGTVFIGVASAAGSRAWGPFMFPGPREKVREAAVTEALVRLREAVVDGAAADAASTGTGGKNGDKKAG